MSPFLLVIVFVLSPFCFLLSPFLLVIASALSLFLFPLVSLGNGSLLSNLFGVYGGVIYLDVILIQLDSVMDI